MKIRRILTTASASVLTGIAELLLVYWIFTIQTSNGIQIEIIQIASVITFIILAFVAVGIVLSTLWAVYAAQKDYRNTTFFYDIARGIFLGVCSPVMPILFLQFGTFEHFIAERKKQWDKTD